MYSDGIKKYAKKNDIVDKMKEVNTPKLICDLVPRQKYLVHYSLLQLGIQQGYRITHIHHIIRFKQAPFIFEYVNMLSEKRAKSKTTVEKNLYKLLFPRPLKLNVLFILLFTFFATIVSLYHIYHCLFLNYSQLSRF